MQRLLFVPILLILLLFPVSGYAATLIKPTNTLGLRGYWPLEEGAGTKTADKSGWRNVGTLAGASIPTWTTGRFGKALQFYDGGGRVSAGNNASLNVGSAFTYSIWAKRTGASVYQWPYLLISGFTHAYYGLRSVNFGDNVVFEYGTGAFDSSTWTNQNCGGGSNLPVGVWKLFTVTYDGSNLTCYVNGVQASTASGVAINPNISAVTLGADASNGAPFNGFLDDARVYARALSSVEVAALYRQGEAVQKIATRNGLVGEWLFNEGSGTQAKDTSGSGNNASLTGTAGWAGGKHGKAVFLVPGTGSVTIATANRLPTSVMTVSAWVKLTSNRNWNNIVRKYWTGASGTWLLFTDVNGAAKFGVYDTGQKNSTTPVGTLIPGKWYHLVGTYDGTNVNVYVNGVVGTPATTPSPVALDTSSTQFDMGNTDDGSIDDVRIYDRVLSISEINSLYRERAVAVNTSQNGKLTNGLVGLWSFDGADIGTAVLDRSGNGLNGYLVGTNNATSSRKTIGKIGQGFTFGGRNTGGIDVGASSLLIPSRFTVAAWEYTATSTYSYNYIFSNTRDCCGPMYGIDFRITGTTLRGIIWNSASYSIASVSSVPINAWNHLVFSYDGANMRLYINGVLDKTQAQTVDPGSPGTYDTMIGSMGHSAGSTYTLDGKLDDVRLYDRALSDAEIKQLYLMGK